MDIQNLVDGYGLFMIAVGAIIIAGASLYIGVRLSAVKAEKVNYVAGDVDQLADQMAEAEKIGHFGSFVWNFVDPSESRWSPHIYELLDMNERRTPPSPEEFFACAEEKNRERVMREWNRILLSSGPFMFSFQAKTTKGRLIHLKVQGKMIPEENAVRARKIEGVITDVTKEMAIDRAKSEFVSLASHQLKTPITSIHWLAEALLRGTAGPLSEQQQTYIKNTLDSSERMIAMINELLNVSRIETDTLAIVPATVDPCALLRSVVDEQKMVADAKHLSLTVKCADNLPAMTADEKLLRMVFQNLVSNAIKYTPEHGTVSCDLSLAETTHAMLFLVVKDSGIGIPKDEQPRVFEKLHRASNAEALIPDGTGLGLYLVKTIIDKVGGGISFESEEGTGTTFFASIPFVWQKSGDKPVLG